MMTNVTTTAIIMKFIYSQYDRLRFLSSTILCELYICNQYIFQYRTYMMNSAKKYKNLFKFSNIKMKVQVRDAVLVNGKLESQTVDVIRQIKHIIRCLIDYQMKLIKYENQMRQSLHIIIKGLKDYQNTYLSYFSEDHNLIITSNFRQNQIMSSSFNFN